VGGGSLWVANHEAGSVTRIEQASGKLVANIPVPSEPHRVAYGAGAAWVGNWHDNSVSRIDPETNRVVGSPIPIGFRAGTSRSALAASGSPAPTAWTPRTEDVVVVRIDPQTNRAVETIAVGGHPIDVAATEDAIWGVGRRPRHGATARRALTRLPDLLAFRSQAATMSSVVRVGRQEWAGCKRGRRDRLQPIRGYERNFWPPRTQPRLSINRAKRTTQRGRSIPLRGHMASHSRLPLSPECRTSRLRRSPIPDSAGRTTTIRICLKRSFWLVSAVLACLSPPATDPRPS
jgi:hypothetical protein